MSVNFLVFLGSSKEATERVSRTEYTEGKAVMSNKEEKECQMTKEEKRRKKREKHKDMGQSGDYEGKAVMSNKEEKDCQVTEEEKKRKKGKKHKDKGQGSNSDSSCARNHSIEMEQADVSAKMAEDSCLEHAEAVTSKSSAKKHRKKKRKDKEVETIGQKQILDADENVGSEDTKRNSREREHDRKSKKHKRKHQDDETASNGSSGNQIVLGEDKRTEKEYLVTLDLEEDNKSDMSKIGKKTDSKKKRRKERNDGVDLRQNTLVGEGKNGKNNKEKKMCEDENGGGEREKENMGKQKDKCRRVSFTDHVEVFNIGGSDDVEGDGSGETELVHGRRFSPEEDAKLMEAILKYAELKQLGEKGLQMIGESNKHPETRGCWAEIGTWSQDEYQNLFDLVNLDMRVKAHQNINTGHRHIRDNISWEAISEKLTTRRAEECCTKWYGQLASPLVKQGIWADTDDYMLVEALQNVDAVCAEDVDWENLLEHRSGELCRHRWNQMIRLMGDHRYRPFIEQVEVLARRYCPEMLAYRKPVAGGSSADEPAGASDL
ncbi:Putative MYB DNA-binding domain superfamily protein [Zea mays]|uniref:Putative MYB DNA-binding domain superfamily protein n=1 Tax=Zea mays TaxID=4577 RepID=A0A1D6PVR1_MAIZE|nr:Putative MYB DNA-binding domain superfamily protein [Zea mays]